MFAFAGCSRRQTTEPTDGTWRTWTSRRALGVDPELFDGLEQLIASGQRSVHAVESMKLWPDARFHSSILPDELSARSAYFESLWEATGSEDLLFFDPDNGVEVPSVPKDGEGARATSTGTRSTLPWRGRVRSASTSTFHASRASLSSRASCLGPSSALPDITRLLCSQHGSPTWSSAKTPRKDSFSRRARARPAHSRAPVSHGLIP